MICENCETNEASVKVVVINLKTEELLDSKNLCSDCVKEMDFQIGK